MESYEKISKIGEGSYGIVYKCRNRATNELVAIKKFVDNVEDELTKKIASREIKMLKDLKHPHLVNLKDVFKRKGKIHLVFEYCDLTLLNEIEQHANKKTTVPEENACSYTLQLLQGLQYCHENNVIHRDVKPENILLTKEGVLKLCDFGFARYIGPADNLTDYVATRWYRAPELLVGDTKYTSAVDVWAVGCVLAELITGKALFMGNSDLDMLFLIRITTGDLLPRFVDMFKKNYYYRGMKLKELKVKERVTLREKMPSSFSQNGIDFLEKCLDRDPEKRWDCKHLQTHSYLQPFLPVNYDEEQEDAILRRSTQSMPNTFFPLLPASTNLPAGTFSASSSPEFRYKDAQKLPNI